MVISSCQKKPSYSSVPYIEYSDFLRYGNPHNPDSVKLVVKFTDNEGDIGFAASDTQIFKKGNFFMIYFYLDTTGGHEHWSAFDTNPATPAIDTLIINYRVPPLLPDGDPSEPMKGSIYVRQLKPISPYYNRIKYRCYLYDKALHKSNVFDTPEIDF